VPSGRGTCLREHGGLAGTWDDLRRSQLELSQGWAIDLGALMANELAGETNQVRRLSWKALSGFPLRARIRVYLGGRRRFARTVSYSVADAEQRDSRAVLTVDEA
jgi:hypothetical protein